MSFAQFDAVSVDSSPTKAIAEEEDDAKVSHRLDIYSSVCMYVCMRMVFHLVSHDVCMYVSPMAYCPLCVQ